LTKVVISYRREDSPGMSGWIHEKLASRYGQDSVFRDIDNLASQDFRRAIGRALRQCDIVVAIIGNDWLGASDTGPRIQRPNDWVRVEIETALQLDIPIVPVLVEGADMPKPDDLPETLKDFSYRNAMRVDSGTDFYAHVDRLMSTIDQIAATHRPQAAPGADRPANGARRPMSHVAAGGVADDGASRIQKILRVIPIDPGEPVVTRRLKWFLRIFVYYMVFSLVVGTIAIMIEAATKTPT
jgi:hypothetical protein